MLTVFGLLVAGCGGNGKDTTAPTPTTTATPPLATAGPPLAASAARVRTQLKGIPQHGLVLGNPKAPITIVEYGSFACPACAAMHRDLVPQVIERYVRTGKASLEFRGVAGEAASPERDLALASWAASAQRHGWDFLQLAYLRSLAESRPVTAPESPVRLARALGLDATRLGTDATRPEWQTQVRAAASVAGAARMTAFPVFLLRARSKQDQPFVVLTRPGSMGSFVDAVAKARKGG
jgi:predicted DsbA family dithiol-disulfide isomerase